jgi:hypothetical protein
MTEGIKTGYYRVLTRSGRWVMVDEVGLRGLQEQERIEREQELEVIRQEHARVAAAAVSQPADHPRTLVDIVAGRLRTAAFPPHGIGPNKEAIEAFKRHGFQVPSSRTLDRAKAHNRSLCAKRS